MVGFFEMRAEDLKKAVFEGLTLVRECLKWAVEISKSFNDGLMRFHFLYKRVDFLGLRLWNFFNWLVF